MIPFDKTHLHYGKGQTAADIELTPVSGVCLCVCVCVCVRERERERETVLIVLVVLQGGNQALECRYGLVGARMDGSECMDRCGSSGV